MNTNPANVRPIVLMVVLVFGLLSGPVPVYTADTPVYSGPRFEGTVPEESLAVMKQIEKGLNYTAEKSRPAVVTIYVEKNIKRPGFPFRFGPKGIPKPRRDEGRSQGRKVRGLGSGVIIRSNGYILTNYHVIKDVNEIKVLLHNKKKVSATVVGKDPRTDLAVLKINRRKLPELDFADSSKLNVGQWALAVGSPFSLSNSVSVGHVSALERSIQATQYENFVQTDAPINRGNSGGPLVNIQGEIIGINTIIQSTSGGNQGVGFASASNLAKRTARDLIQYGEVKRAWMGVSIQGLSKRNLQSHFDATQGAVVVKVMTNSPAADGGLKRGDLILAMDGTSIESPTDLQRRVIQHEPGEQVGVVIQRNGEQKKLTITLGERPDAGTSRRANRSERKESILDKLGLSLTEISPEEANRSGFNVDQPILQIQRIQRGSLAHQSGLRPKDLILSINRTPVKGLNSFRKKMNTMVKSGTESVLLLIHRDGRRLYRSLALPNNPG
ncbi:MAG: Do family serine endopeptidase [bacterium]